MQTLPYVTSVRSSEGVTTIEFATAQHNALPTEQLLQLAASITTVGQDADCRCIILRSGGNRTFCAGASFTELVAVRNAEEGKAFFSGFAGVINAMRTCPKLIIGRVQGKAVGGGVGLAAACDLVYATKHASIKLSELAIGIGPFVIGPAVARKLSVTTFGEIALRPTEFFDAAFAKTRGLFTEVLDTPEQLDAAVDAKAAELATYQPAACTNMKAMLWEGTDHWEQLLADRAATSGKLLVHPSTRAKLVELTGQGA